MISYKIYLSFGQEFLWLALNKSLMFFSDCWSDWYTAPDGRDLVGKDALHRTDSSYRLAPSSSSDQCGRRTQQSPFLPLHFS